MSFSLPSNSQNYSEYGFSAEKSNEDKEPFSYSEYGFSPEAPELKDTSQKPTGEKIGKVKSALYGLAEGILGIPALVQYGVNEYSKALEMDSEDEKPKLSFEKENPIAAFMSTFPVSEDEGARRIRAAAQAGPLSTVFGIPGIIAGLVGSQAGQTIREVYGTEGKFKEFGWGEAGALAADMIAGGVSGALASAARGAGRAATTGASNVPSIFQRGETGLEKAIIKNTIQGEKNTLQKIIEDFGASQIQGFEQQASALSPDRYTNLTQSSSSALKRQAENMFRNTQLRMISPIEATPEQGGRALQEAANTVFENTVLRAERNAYSAARDAAEGLTGTAPRTINQAKQLRDDLLKVTPTSEQQPVIGFLNGLIDDLETVTPASSTPASKLLDASGKPLIPATEIPASAAPTTRSANDLVDLVQRANHAVNYGSEVRQQSHRLKPIVNTLREEVGNILRQNPAASTAYQEANNLHATNAETWGTKFMRNLRFSENPESNIPKMKLASNMNNFKTGITDSAMQALAERLVIQDVTEKGSSQANRITIQKLAPELSANANNAAEQLIQVKDPLTSSGGRAAVRNAILTDAAQSVSTGKRPEKILDLMQTPKGYQIVQETMSASPESRRLFRSFQRLFIEDIFKSITDKSGQIDFTKAKNILKNDDVRQVVERIGGESLVSRFRQLENLSQNLQRNLNLYKNPETQSFFKELIKKTKSAGLIGAILHALHIPLPVIAALGFGKALLEGGKVSFNALKSKLLMNPRAIRALEAISNANSTEELAKQAPRLIKEFESVIEEE